MDRDPALYIPTIFDAVQDDDLNQVIQLIGSDPQRINATDDSGFTPLMLASMNGSTAIVEVLLQAGADLLKATFSSGNNALFWACYKGHTAVAKQLLAHLKAKATRGTVLQFVGLKNRNGDTALMFAANAGHHEVAHYLRTEGADLTVTNNAKMTALHCAAANQHFDTVAQLIASHVSLSKDTVQSRQQLQRLIDARDQQGRTALLMAAEHGAASVLDQLLKHGADLSCQNHAHETALDVAKRVARATSGEAQDRALKCVELLEQRYRLSDEAMAALLRDETSKSAQISHKNTSSKQGAKKKKKTKSVTDTATKTNATPTQPSESAPVAVKSKPADSNVEHVHDKEASTKPQLAAQASVTPVKPKSPSPKFSYASIVSKDLPPSATPPTTPVKTSSTTATPNKRSRPPVSYNANSADDMQELLRKAQAYDLLQQTLDATRPQSAQLGLECEHLFGLNLSSLSMSQLTALEELHFDALKQLSEAKVDFVRDLEQIRQEERLTLERMIMRLTKQLNEGNE